MAKKYREKLPAGLVSHKLAYLPTNALPFDNEASMYANWKWFKFESEHKPV
jgi:small subunit ribosomal protein S1